MNVQRSIGMCGVIGILAVLSSGCEVHTGAPEVNDLLFAGSCYLAGGSVWDAVDSWDSECRWGKRTKSAAASEGEVLLIPATAHVSGALGTDWRSDLELHNLAEETAAVTIVMLRNGADNTSAPRRSVTVAGGESLRLADVLDSQFDRDGQAALVLAVESGRVIATSRTFNLLAAGNPLGLPGGSTFGQSIPALNKTGTIRYGEQGRLIQLSHSNATDGGFRANLGVVGLTAAGLHVDVDLHDGEGQHLGTVPIDLPPYGFVQVNRVFERVTSGEVVDGYAVVRTTTGGGRFAAYASVVDNLTGDPIAIPATRLPEEPPQETGDPLWVVAAAHVAGAAGTNWRTDLEVHNWGDTQADYRIALLLHGEDNSDPQSANFTLAAGACERFEDVLAREFGFEGQAALRITPTVGNLLVSSRTFNLLGAGNPAGLPAGATFGQYIPGVGSRQAIRADEEGRLIQLSNSPGGSGGFRTNLVLVSASAIPVDVEIDLVESDGGLLGSVSRSLAPYEYRQINRVFEEVTGAEVTDGMLMVRTSTANGAVFALASVVDNLTGDPVGFGAQVVRSGPSEGALVQFETVLDVLGQTTIDSVVDGIQTVGVDPMLDTMVGIWPPGVATRTQGGLVAEYGDGTTMPGGSVWSGSTTINASGFGVGGSDISGTVTIVHDDVTIDGEPAGMASVAWTVDLERRADGTVVGTVSAEPLGSNSAAGSVGGAIVIDTAICERYPISGRLTVVANGEVVTIEPSPECDGSADAVVQITPPEVDFAYTFADPWDPRSMAFVTSVSNAEVSREGDVGGYWRPMMGAATYETTTPGVITFHHGFDRPVVGGELRFTLATFHWWYSRGHAFLYGSTDGVSWQLLTEVPPPEFGQAQAGGWFGPLPSMFVGSSDIWLQARLYSFGENADAGGVYCNTAQMFRWHPSQSSNSFELFVDLQD